MWIRTRDTRKYPMLLDLPIPSYEAQQHSLKLQTLLKERIKERGALSFHDYMQCALYEPGLGYYNVGTQKFGAAGDFITAPELSALFGATVVESFSSLAEPLDWLEFGAGSGKLACSILKTLQKKSTLPKHYYILEVSADLKNRQQIFLQENLPADIFKRLIWLDTLPTSFSGIILANEVFDALPVHRFAITERGAQEQYVILNDDNTFKFTLGTPSIEKLNQQAAGLNLPLGYESEFHFAQESLIKTLADRLTHGFLLCIDYGFSEKNYYHPEKNQGTLRCYYQHRLHEDVFFWPGLQDITTHINFTALARAGIEAGLNLLTYSTQEQYLLHNHILQLAEADASSLDSKEKILQQQALRQLISPLNMGEMFKIMLFEKNTGVDFPWIEESDQRYLLG